MSDSTTVPSLAQFPRIPNAGKITVAESHSEVHSLPSTSENPSTGRGFSPLIVKYSAIDGNQLTSRLPFKIPSVRITANRTAPFIVSPHQSIPKALWDSWWEEGLRGVYGYLQSADNSQNLGTTSKTVFKICAILTGLWVNVAESPSKVLSHLFPHLEWKVEEVNEQFSHVRRWPESWIRAMDWHPTAPYLALAMNDDSVRCCVIGKDVVPMLRRQQQRNISCVAWRPFVMSELAVGCEDCIVIWYLTSTVSMKPGKDKTVILKVNGHSPVNSVEYSSDGNYLLSSSAKDASVYIWDACLYHKAPLTRIGGGGIPLSLWSPRGNRILAASPNKTFWIWENNNSTWTFKRWDTGGGNTMIEAASWHPSGNTLLFAAGGCLYGLFFELSPVDRFVAQRDSIVKLVYNIGETHMLDEDGNLEYKIGGKVRQIQWDPSGHRVAILFDDSEMIAVFRVLIKSRGDLLAPLGFIRGHPDENPLAIAFQKDFCEGALLTIAWSTGRIQYFPMIFALPSDKKNILHEDHYRAQHVIHGQPSMFAAAGIVSPRLSVSGMERSTNAPNISSLFAMQQGGGEDVVSPSSRLYSIPKN